MVAHPVKAPIEQVVGRGGRGRPATRRGASRAPSGRAARRAKGSKLVGGELLQQHRRAQRTPTCGPNHLYAEQARASQPSVTQVERPVGRGGTASTAAGAGACAGRDDPVESGTVPLALGRRSPPPSGYARTAPPPPRRRAAPGSGPDRRSAPLARPPGGDDPGAHVRVVVEAHATTSSPGSRVRPTAARAASHAVIDGPNATPGGSAPKSGDGRAGLLHDHRWPARRRTCRHGWRCPRIA